MSTFKCDLEITVFNKSSGPLTKTISLAENGSIRSDGSACVMSQGRAKRLKINTGGQFGNLLNAMSPNEAIALGRLRSDFPKDVLVLPKGQVVDGATATIARTADNLVYSEGQALALLDHDTKGMPGAVADRLKELGGFWNALVSVMQALGTAAHVMRSSTSAGLYRSDTGEELPGSNGLHVFVLVKDGRDVERFIKTLHDRCWLAGFGWLVVGAGGQLLERSIVDRVVGGAERLVFEGPPTLKPPLAQDQDKRRPIVSPGDALDTIAACPPLTIIEKSKLSILLAGETQRLASEVAKSRAAFVKAQSRRLADRTGISTAQAERAIGCQCDGVLLPSFELAFDEETLRGCTVLDVLADPDRFEGETLADPLEGADYGRCKAKIMHRADGSLWINSFAHGRTTYEIKHDLRSVRAGLQQACDDDAVKTLIKLDGLAELDEVEWETLRHEVAKRCGANITTINRQRKKARDEQAGRRAEELRTRRFAERRDPRPRVPVPPPDAEWIPQISTINECLAGSSAHWPPMRDIDGVAQRVRKRSISTMHAFASQDANPDQKEQDHD